MLTGAATGLIPPILLVSWNILYAFYCRDSAATAVLECFADTALSCSSQWLASVGSALQMGGDVVLTSVLIYILHTSRTGISRYVYLADFVWHSGARIADCILRRLSERVQCLMFWLCIALAQVRAMFTPCSILRDTLGGFRADASGNKVHLTGNDKLWNAWSISNVIHLCIIAAWFISWMSCL